MKKISTTFLLLAMGLGTVAQAQTTYNDVAEIFYTECSGCHHEGGLGPFPLMNYMETSSFSASISAAVNKGSMPPWHADTNYVASGRKGPRFLHETTLSIDQKNAILQWIADGALEGNPDSVPTAPKYGKMEYRLNGIADLTLQIPTYASNAAAGGAAGSDPYNCFAIPMGLTQDRWLRAYEIVPGNEAIVHHVVVTVDTVGNVATDTSGNCGAQGGEFGIGGWSSGAPPTVYPNGPALKTGKRIPAGSNVIIQIHFAPGSGGQLDSTKIRLFFYPIGEPGIRPMNSEVLLQQWGSLTSLFPGGIASLPKNTIKTWDAYDTTSLLIGNRPPQPDSAMSIFAVNPHSHNLCREIVNYAFKGTDTIPIISISNWDYNWQGPYYLPKPLVIPAGYRLKSEHVFDNTIDNPHINGAPVDVNFGQATSDEMLFDSFQWMDYQAGDEDIDIKALLDVDTLFLVGIENLELTASFESTIFPNPSADQLSITLSKLGEYQATIFNVAGQEVLNTGSFTTKISVDVSDVAPGLYLLEIVDTNTNERISKKIVVSNE